MSESGCARCGNRSWFLWLRVGIGFVCGTCCNAIDREESRG